MYIYIKFLNAILKQTLNILAPKEFIIPVNYPNGIRLQYCDHCLHLKEMGAAATCISTHKVKKWLILIPEENPSFHLKFLVAQTTYVFALQAQSTTSYQRRPGPIFLLWYSCFTYRSGSILAPLYLVVNQT
jgi:hypothetical protein